MVDNSLRSNCIQIFSKAAIEGYCKTRLIPELGNEKTLFFHKRMLKKTVETSINVPHSDTQLWCTPSLNHNYFKQLDQQYPIQLYLQQGSNLGEIMSNAACQAFASYNNVIQIGIDCPAMTVDYIEKAIESLDDNLSCVIGPATDGGYVLFAINKYYSGYYENIAWGTHYVLQQLETNLRSYNVNYILLEMLSDIDTYTDYKKWKLSQ